MLGALYLQLQVVMIEAIITALKKKLRMTVAAFHGGDIEDEAYN